MVSHVLKVELAPLPNLVRPSGGEIGPTPSCQRFKDAFGIMLDIIRDTFDNYSEDQDMMELMERMGRDRALAMIWAGSWIRLDDQFAIWEMSRQLPPNALEAEAYGRSCVCGECGFHEEHQ